MKIAVVGSGVSGLVSAYMLSAKHDVYVFEKNDYIGGHTATNEVEVAGKIYRVDTGFIVFNDKTYPNFRALMRELKVSWRDTEMSFSVTDPVSGLEYNGHNLNTLFAQRRNFFKPSFYRLVNGILKFNKEAKAALARGEDLDDVTLGEFLQQHNLPASVVRQYLLPMVAAIWSASLAEAEQFPLGFFLRFFENHGLLNVADRPQWATICGGSNSYIPPLIEPFKHNIQLNSQIERVERKPSDQGNVCLTFASGQQQWFDEVIMACHSDEALALLADSSNLEQEILGAIPYQDNDVVLHTDKSLLPNRQLAWASWNYLLNDGAEVTTRPSSVTYNMNILQGIEAPEVFCVTLNNTSAIDADKILRRFTYGHPVYSVASLAARKRRGEICGQQHTHFCGAYWYNGFHEDGVRSALDVAKALGCEWSC
ncbi:Predicted NAD/FAD-binding protein [Pseudidiomarina planktonica]|uniref:Predicted NAD/FAD-binding protein n=1 Tax=Pseudidiomarina planktonica TaxID=1323738 RepID=A0A1Y6EVG2_9GAMM|nr:FAD-dependent oxidoreductase [Pseudidiomarina planktonica]RUO65380.1 FAD-dependent oxidoreductase [Pseudidiomarina planktonica]SMQ65241.1 Predicted NAD/FAD-binding protein [Pseudidiomarina planktonica]